MASGGPATCACGVSPIFSSLVVSPRRQRAYLPESRLMLGNIKKKPLDRIFNSHESAAAQCRHQKECNGCWINFHRKYDIILLRNLERLLPKN